MKMHLGLVALLLAACGEKDPDDSAPSDDTGQGSGTLAEVQAIVDQSCSGCHTDGGTSGNLTMDEVHGATVGVPSTQAAGMMLVEAGSRDGSYLWHKLNGTHTDVGGSGAAMPMSGSLNAGDLETIGLWIDAGAPE